MCRKNCELGRVTIYELVPIEALLHHYIRRRFKRFMGHVSANSAHDLGNKGNKSLFLLSTYTGLLCVWTEGFDGLCHFLKEERNTGPILMESI